MISPGRWLGVPLCYGVLLLGAGAVRAAAQDVPPPPPPPIRGIPTPPSTDSTRRADTSATTPTTYWVPTFPTTTAPGPLPTGTRFVFTADSLRFTGALTLADLLVRIPGVYIARGGFYGQAEVAFYGGRGAAGIEVYWDGMPYLPVGRDSVFLDVGRIALAPVERIEVVRSADRLRVDLFTHNPEATDPRTGVLIATGDLDIGTYQAAFARRWRSGLGLALAANYSSLNGDAGTTTEARQSDVWLKFEFVPRATLGASYQLLRTSLRRAASDTTAARLVDGWRSERRDGVFRAFVASRANGLGWRLDGSVGSSTADGDTLVATDRVYQTALQVSHTWPRAAVTLVGRLGYGHRPQQVEGTAGWVALPWLQLGGSARLDGYDGGRNGSRFAGSVGVRFPLGFSARGEIVAGDQISAPRWLADSAQHTLDWTGAVRWETRFALLEVARTERDPFQAFGAPAGLRPLDLVGPTPQTSMLTVHAVVRPAPALTLSAWYADPVRGGGDFELPSHSRFAVTFFSKFWRVFKSGAFALRAEGAAEAWSAGLGGMATVDTITNTTTQLLLSGSTFFDWNVEMQIVGVTLFWQMRNANAMRKGYVPRLQYPTIVQVYGARWSFRN